MKHQKKIIEHLIEYSKPISMPLSKQDQRKERHEDIY